VTLTIDALLALRHRVPDAVLLDCADLARLVEPPCTIPTRVLREHWCCHQSSVSRRLRHLWEAELLDYCAGRGAYHVRRIGPPVTKCDSTPPTG
jgi:hypothetical protein